jgi:hypothetical protein
MDNKIVSPDILKLSVAICANGIYYRPGRFWIEAAIDCLHVCSGGMISVKSRDTNLIRKDKFRTANNTFPSLCIFIPRNPWQPLKTLSWGASVYEV